MPITLPAPTLGNNMNTQKFGARVQQGSQVYLMVGSLAVGYITSVSQNDSYGTQPFKGMGTIMPLEIQALDWSGSLNVSGGRLWDASWQSVIMSPGTYILSQGLVNIVVYNRATQQPDVVFVGCAPTTYTSTWAANAFSVQSGTWMYMDVKVAGFGSGSNGNLMLKSQIGQASSASTAANLANNQAF